MAAANLLWSEGYEDGEGGDCDMASLLFIVVVTVLMMVIRMAMPMVTVLMGGDPLFSRYARCLHT